MPDTPGMQRYRSLIELRMQARQEAGGKLTQAEEAAWTAYVDRVWATLSDEEQEALDPPPLKLFQNAPGLCPRR